MVRSLFAILALAAAYSVTALAADPINLHDAEMDGGGKIWAENGAANTLYTFDGSAWSNASAPFPKDVRATPYKLARFNDGSVAGIWSTSPNSFAVTRHNGNESRIILQASGSLPSRNPEWANLFCDSQNRLWITARSPQVRWVDPDGNSKLVYELTNSDLVNPLKSASSFNPLFATQDGRKRIWIWANAGAGTFSRSSLNGVLLCEGDRVERKTLPGLDGKLFGPMLSRDLRHMWVAVQGDGIYEVDIDSLASRRLDDPAPKAFAHLQQMFVFKDDVYVVTDYPSEGKLWRQRDGKWTCLIENLEKNSQLIIRPWLADGGALLLAARSGLWVLREGREPIKWNWANGFPVDAVDRMFLLPDHRLFALGGGGATFCGKIEVAETAPRIEELPATVDCAMDAAGHVWYVAQDGGNVLREWNGHSWTSHPLPKDLEKLSFYQISPDEQGRIWIFPYAQSRPAAFFDTRENEWRAFATTLSAFDSVPSDLPRFFESAGASRRPPLYHPTYRGNCMACLVENRDIAYFDGKSWRVWKLSAVVPGATSSGRPFFNADDLLCVNIGKETWAWSDAKGWTHVKTDANFSDESGQSRLLQASLPDGVRADAGRGVIRDNNQTLWYLWKKNLYKAVSDASSRIFSPDEPNPFLLQRQLTDVFVDPTGVAFIKTASDTNRWYMLRPKTSLPVIEVSLDTSNPLIPVASLQTVSGSNLRFRWQLDDSPWQWITDTKVSLEGLSNGEHTLRVEAVDDELQTARPAAVKFETQTDPSAQMAALVQRLADADFTHRESAVKALLRRPDDARSALEKSRAAANKDQRWWIDATLQEIEAQAAKKNAASSP